MGGERGTRDCSLPMFAFGLCGFPPCVAHLLLYTGSIIGNSWSDAASVHTHASSHAFNQLNWPILSFLRQNLLGPDYTEISSTLKEEHANGRKGKRSCTYNTTDFCCKRMESDDDKQLPTMRAHEPLPAPTFSYTLYKYFCFFKPTKCKDDDRL